MCIENEMAETKWQCTFVNVLENWYNEIIQLYFELISQLKLSNTNLCERCHLLCTSSSYQKSKSNDTREDVRLLSALKHIAQLHWEWHHDDGILCTLQPYCITFAVCAYWVLLRTKRERELAEEGQKARDIAVIWNGMKSGEQTIRIWDDNDDPITLKYAISNLQFCTYMSAYIFCRSIHTYTQWDKGK